MRIPDGLSNHQKAQHYINESIQKEQGHFRPCSEVFCGQQNLTQGNKDPKKGGRCIYQLVSSDPN